MRKRFWLIVCICGLLVILTSMYVRSIHIDSDSLTSSQPPSTTVSTSGDVPLPAPTATTTSLATTMHAMLEGVWRATDDTRALREFRTDGTEIDSYVGDSNATATSTWRLFTSQNPDVSLQEPLVDGVVYLKLTSGDGTLFFAVEYVTTRTLNLTYLGRGNTLSYTRVR